jgi:hypothetical protein
VWKVRSSQGSHLLIEDDEGIRLIDATDGRSVIIEPQDHGHFRASGYWEDSSGHARLTVVATGYETMYVTAWDLGSVPTQAPVLRSANKSG